MIGPFSAYAMGRTNWIVRDSEGERVCTLYDQRWDHNKLVAEAIAGMLNAAPAGTEAVEVLKAMRDKGSVEVPTGAAAGEGEG